MCCHNVCEPPGHVGRRASARDFEVKDDATLLQTANLEGSEEALDRSQMRTRRRRSALPMTVTELKLMAAAASIGDNSQPVHG